jgi:geranylgeranyl pyrophosphate synthase
MTTKALASKRQQSLRRHIANVKCIAHELKILQETVAVLRDTLEKAIEEIEFLPDELL